jgi:hypothetical protein
MEEPTVAGLLARLEEQQARIELLESRTIAPGAGPAADEPAESGPHRKGLTRRGMVKTAAAGAAGIVGAMLIEPEGVASAADAGGPGKDTVARSRERPPPSGRAADGASVAGPLTPDRMPGGRAPTVLRLPA